MYSVRKISLRRLSRGVGRGECSCAFTGLRRCADIKNVGQQGHQRQSARVEQYNHLFLSGKYMKIHSYIFSIVNTIYNILHSEYTTCIPQ